MIYEINYALIMFIVLIITYPVVVISLLVYDWIKGNEIRIGYRLIWPFVLFGEVFG